MAIYSGKIRNSPDRYLIKSQQRHLIVNRRNSLHIKLNACLGCSRILQDTVHGVPEKLCDCFPGIVSRFRVSSFSTETREHAVHNIA